MSVKLVRGKESFMSKISIKNEGTQEGYKVALANFENFFMEKYGKTDYIADLSAMPQDDVFDILQFWINWNNKRGLASRTITNFFSRLKNYLHYRGIKLDPMDIKTELDFPRHEFEELYGLKLEDIQKITDNLRYKQKTQFICQLSSCMRIGELLQLRKKHISLVDGNFIVEIPSSIAKFSKGRTTFFSKEATKLLIPIVRKLDDNDLIFGSSEKTRSAIVNAEQILKRTLIRIGLDMKYETKGDKTKYKINTHSFRAYGITKLSRHDPNLAKKIAGQKGYLLEYDRMDPEEKLEIYQKYESDLFIDDSAKQKSKIKELEKEHEEVKDLKLRLEMMEKILAENNLTSLKTYDLAYPEAHKEHLKLLKKLESGEIQEK